MDKNKLHTLIKQTVNEEIIRESLVSLDHLHDGISTSTMVGKPWYSLISGLESVVNEVKDFKGMYSSAHHGPHPNTGGALIQLQMIAKILEGIKPVIMGMDDIQKKDR